MASNPTRPNPMSVANLLNPSKEETPNHSSNDVVDGYPMNRSIDQLSISSILNPPHRYRNSHGVRKALPLRAKASRKHNSRRRSNCDSRLHHRHTPLHPAQELCSPTRLPRHRQPSRGSYSSESMSPPTHLSETGSSSQPKVPHSNRKYTQEQVDWTRYMKEDCKYAWKALPARFSCEFPDTRDSDQCFSSRYYRNNEVPMHNNIWEPVFDENGKLRMMPTPVRQRGTPLGMLLDIPYTLVEKHPERALTYSWVREEHKAHARKIVAGKCTKGNKHKWRLLIRNLEDAGLLGI